MLFHGMDGLLSSSFRCTLAQQLASLVSRVLIFSMEVVPLFCFSTFAYYITQQDGWIGGGHTEWAVWLVDQE